MKNCVCNIGFWLIILCLSCSTPKNTIIKDSEIPTCTSEQIAFFEFTKRKTEGVHGYDPENEGIQYIVAKDNDIAWPDKWSPVNGLKMAVNGKLHNYIVHNPIGDEYDWNLNIVPNTDFKYIIEDPKSRAIDTTEWKRCETSGTYEDCFQAEITPDEHLYNNFWFPKQENRWNPRTRMMEKHTPDSPLEGRDICVYGPWVLDSGHDWRPEIHPCELIWWRDKERNQDTFYLFGIQDDSNRFDIIEDFVFDETQTLEWRPWAAPPLTSRFKIAFEYNPNNNYLDHLVLNIEELKIRNVVTALDKNASEDSDSDNDHLLLYKSNDYVLNNKIIAVNKNISSGENLGVKFVDICKKDDGTIIGYVQITTKYGKGPGEEGYHLLRATLKYPTLKGPIIAQ